MGLGHSILNNALGIPKDYILRYDFDGNLADKSVNMNDAIGLANYTIGKDGIADTAIDFSIINGLVTTNNIILQDKFSISFWMKNTNPSLQILFELSNNHNYNNNAFLIDINELTPYNNIIMSSREISLGNAKKTGIVNVNNGIWKHIIIINDRSKVSYNEWKVMVNLEEKGLINIYNGDSTHNYSLNKLYIGARNNTSYKYTGQMQNFRMYDRVLKNSEINSLYNE